MVDIFIFDQIVLLTTTFVEKFIVHLFCLKIKPRKKTRNHPCVACEAHSANTLEAIAREELACLCHPGYPQYLHHLCHLNVANNLANLVAVKDPPISSWESKLKSLSCRNTVIKAACMG